MPISFAGQAAMPVTKATAPKFTRGDVLPGQIFAYVDSKGALKKGRFGAVGRNGRLLSLNMETGALSSSPNADAEVKVVGTYQFKVKLNGSDAVVNPADMKLPEASVGVQKRRSTVQDGEIFVVKGQETLYAHLGVLDKGITTPKYCSVPLAGRPDNYATKSVTGKDSTVYVVGTLSIDVVSLK